jgi:hypothetical protein
MGGPWDKGASMGARKLLVTAVCATAVVVMSAGPTFAGEVTGTGEPTAIREHAQSICAFSGLNDSNPPPGRTAAHVQSWGQIPKVDRDFLTTVGAHPGDACNGHTGFFAGG